MKKLILFVLALAMVLASATANAATIPAGSITITAQTVDYVSALAGIAKPTNTAHYENERFAVLVTVNVPSWYDTSNMGVVIEKTGLAIDSAAPVAVATGNYLVFGTLYSTSGVLKVTLQDNALGSAATAQALWAALYGDRTVSATVNFAPAAIYPTAGTVQTTPVIEIPQTGDAPIAIIAAACIVVAGICLFIVRRGTV